MFKGILIDKDEAGYHVNLTDIDEARLPSGEVTINVSHSTLNYKDALAITGQSPIVRSYPMVPGIDLAGTVEASDTLSSRSGTRFCSMAGVSAKGIGAGWRKRPGSRANGSFLCHRPSRRRRRWPSARRATPRCSVSWHWKSTV